MDEKIDAAIEKMADQVKSSPDPTRAQQFSQAALNLAHVRHLFLSMSLEGKSTKTKGTGA